VTNADEQFNMTPASFETADMTNPREFAAWAVAFFPDPRENFKGHLVPFHGATPDLSEQLWKFGFRHHPELQEDYPRPGNQPGMGPLNPWKKVTKEEYDAYRATHTAPAPTEGNAANAEFVLRQLFSAIDPDAAKRIAEMSPEEKAAMLPTAEQVAIPALDQLARLRQFIDKGHDPGAGPA
jgi:hypothetical protein